MSRIAAGDEAAMHGLFSRHNIAVYRFLLQQLRDKALAEEVTSEVFLDVWRHPRAFEGRSTVLTWILANARRRALSTRSSRRGPGFDRAADPGSGDEPDAPLQAADHSAVLRSCITRLSAEHREVIDLVYYQEQSMDSVATILGISPNTARTRVFSARQRIADKLKKSGVDWLAI